MRFLKKQQKTKNKNNDYVAELVQVLNPHMPETGASISRLDISFFFK